MTEKRRNGTLIYFDFQCPGCGAAGELGINTKDGTKSFGCPEGCGSTFAPWQRNGGWELKCVVQRCSRRLMCATCGALINLGKILDKDFERMKKIGVKCGDCVTGAVIDYEDGVL